MSTCANCDKGEDEDTNKLKACTACKLVKYCNRECQIAHRPKHKKECKKRSAEIYDEKLFKQPPPLDDCQICFIRLPSLESAQTYQACCGKMFCSGCLCSVKAMDGVDKCPFCRIPMPVKMEGIIERYRKRMGLDDGDAIYNLGYFYAEGRHGLTQDYTKALEYYHRAGELGSSEAVTNIAVAYYYGRGVERDVKKARQYWEKAAIMGNVNARYSIGYEEEEARNISRAKKHYMIAVRDGCGRSLKAILELYSKEYATKEEYENALQAYQEYVAEIKTSQRDDAAELMDKKYY